MMTTEGASPGFVQTTGGYGDGFGGGCGWWGFLIIALLFSNGGFGFGNRGFGPMGDNPNTEVWKAQDIGQIQDGVRANGNGIADAAFALNNSIKDGMYANAMATKDAQFAIQRDIDNQSLNAMREGCQNTHHITDHVSAVAGEVARGNSAILRGIDGVNYAAALNTASINANTTAQVQKVLDTLCCNEKARLAQELADSKMALMEARIVASQKPIAPVPAYNVASPYNPYYPQSCGGCCGSAA